MDSFCSSVAARFVVDGGSLEAARAFASPGSPATPKLLQRLQRGLPPGGAWLGIKDWEIEEWTIDAVEGISLCVLLSLNTYRKGIKKFCIQLENICIKSQRNCQSVLMLVLGYFGYSGWS